MAISFTPKVGQVLQCQFGQFGGAPAQLQGPPDFNRRIPPEMVKNRLVIVLNGRLSRHSCIVVPLSRSQDLSKTSAGVHVEIASDAICLLDYFTPCRRWAKADCIQTVSNRRLLPPNDATGSVEWVVDAQVVRRIQRAAIKAMNASALLIPIAEQALLIEGSGPLKSTS
jgi:uncharacterized protein YifN (PemK superfamily)